MSAWHVGALRWSATIQAPTTVADGHGGQTVTWSTLAVVWGDLRNVALSEGLQGGGVKGQGTATLRIRYRSDVVLQQRVVIGSTTYEVTGVLDQDGRRVWLDLALAVLV